MTAIELIRKTQRENRFKLSIAIPIAVAMVKSRCDEQSVKPSTEVNYKELAADAVDMADALIKEVFGDESPISDDENF